MSDVILARAFGEGLRILRARHRMSQADLATSLGVARQNVCVMESPTTRRSVTVNDLVTACRIFNVGVPELLFSGRLSPAEVNHLRGICQTLGVYGEKPSWLA